MSAMAELDLPPLTVTMGPCLVGAFLSATLYGVTALQTFQYFNKYGNKDKLYIRLLVTVTWALDTFGVASNMYCMWLYLVKNAQNPLLILHIDWSLAFSMMAGQLIGFLVQSFYSYRVWILNSKGYILPAVIMLLASASFTLIMWYTAEIFRNGTILYIPSVTWASTASLALGLATDGIIAVSMTVFLLRGRQGFKKTDNIIQKLTVYTISTGVITTITTLVTLILGLLFKATFLNTITYFPLPKCYVNSFLAFLNVREYLRNVPTQNTSQNIYMSTPSTLQSKPKASKANGLNHIELGTVDTLQFSADLSPDHTAMGTSGFSGKQSNLSL